MDKYTDLRDTFIEIDLNAISDNTKAIRNMVGPDVAITAVVKANGYGHGAVEIAETLIEAGVTYLALATLSEALEIREVYPDYPLFIMGHTPDRLLHYVVNENIAQTVFSYEQAEIISRLAVETGKTARIHIKVDTGFHRLGKEPDEAYFDEVMKINKLPGIELEGIFSHLALASAADDQLQFSKFTEFYKKLEAAGCKFRYHHIADSIACVDYPQFRLNMVRPGAIIYGMVGYKDTAALSIRQALKFRSAISQIHHLEIGDGVSYDFDWRAEKPSIVATIPFGYADGYPRAMMGKGYVTIRGIKCPLVGIPCMDQCFADVTDVPGVSEGDEAVIYGDGPNEMTIAEAAKLAGSNKNEIIARLMDRPKRKYIK